MGKRKFIIRQSKMNADLGYYARLGDIYFPDVVGKEAAVGKQRNQVSFTRPKAIYNNHTPYGIADALR